MHDEFIPEAFVHAFKTRFGENEQAVRVFRAPARINLIGEHIDYNGGKVFPAAIDRYLSMAIRPRDDEEIHIQNLEIGGSTNLKTSSFSAKPETSSWISYLRGVYHFLFGDKIPEHGFDALFTSNVPMGAGVSSSAALELCFAYGLSRLYKLPASLLELVHISRKAEHEYAGVHCGIMDQYAVAFGKKDQAMLLDTATCTHEYAPIKLTDYVIMLINTNKPRSLADSKYNERLAECMEGLAQLKKVSELSSIQHLCDLSIKDFETHKASLTNKVIQKRVKHCVYENKRVLDSAEVLKQGNIGAFGKLLIESHLSLREDYEVTGAHLDAIFDAAKYLPYCAGVRMTGAGFGGCAIALVEKNKTSEFSRDVGEAYTKSTGLKASFYPVTIGEGVHELE